jgi:hypothetical protein
VASSHTWQQLFDLARKRFAKGVPLNDSSEQLLITNLVSGEIWRSFPWRISLDDIPSGSTALVDGTQDYDPPTNIFRLTKASIVRTDVTPNDHRELNVAGDLSVDLRKRSPYQIQAVSHQPAAGKIRLDSAVQIASGTTWELRGEFQTNHAAITTLATAVWFDDQFSEVALEGYLYHFYKLADDPRAGGIVKVEHGKAQFSGQYAAFRAQIDMMAAAEEYGGEHTLAPADGSIGSDAGISIPGLYGN